MVAILAWSPTRQTVQAIARPGAIPTRGWATAGQFFTGDVNGDGKTDIIQVWNNGGYTGMVAYTSNGTGYSPTWSNTNSRGWARSVSTSPETSTATARPTLFRSGAMAAILAWSPIRRTVQAIPRTWSTASTGFGYMGQYFTGDVNGDGKTDIAQLYNSNNSGY